MCELIVPQIHHLQPLVTGQACTQPRETVLVQPNTVPLKGEAGNAVVQTKEAAKQDNGVPTDVVPFKEQRLDRGVLSKALKTWLDI